MKIDYKSILPKLIILLGSIFVFLILFELFLAFTASAEMKFNAESPHFCMYKDDPVADYVLWPNMESLQITRELSFYSKTNSLGLRESRELQEEKDPKIVRIFFVGDSYVFGYGVNQDKTIPILLEEKLNKNLNGKKFEVFNLGIPGHNFATENNYFDRFKKFEPDIVLIGGNVSDIISLPQDNCKDVSNLKCLNDLSECLIQEEKQIFDEYLGNLKIYNFFKDRTSFFFPDPKYLKGWEIEKKNLNKLINKIKAINATPIVIIIPTPDVFVSTGFVKQQHKWIADAAKEQNVLAIDLTDKVLEISKEKQLYYQWVDSHFNEDGTNLAAEEIAKFIESELE